MPTVMFADFVQEQRKRNQQFDKRLEAIEKRQEQLEARMGMLEDSQGEFVQEHKMALAEMSAQLQQTNEMISELLDNMPEGEEEEPNYHGEEEEVDNDDLVPALEFFEGEQTE
jgi:uncharacterized protein YhaN